MSTQSNKEKYQKKAYDQLMDYLRFRYDRNSTFDKIGDNIVVASGKTFKEYFVIQYDPSDTIIFEQLIDKLRESNEKAIVALVYYSRRRNEIRFVNVSKVS